MQLTRSDKNSPPSSGLVHTIHKWSSTLGPPAPVPPSVIAATVPGRKNRLQGFKPKQAALADRQRDGIAGAAGVLHHDGGDVGLKSQMNSPWLWFVFGRSFPMMLNMVVIALLRMRGL